MSFICNDSTLPIGKFQPVKQMIMDEDYPLCTDFCIATGTGFPSSCG